jgi:hypothetical protein
MEKVIIAKCSRALAPPLASVHFFTALLALLGLPRAGKCQ